VNEPWRDTASPDWVMSWGRVDETDWLERELGLKPGRYRLVSLRERLRFVDPKYGELKDLFLYDLTVGSGAETRKVVTGELSNGIWAQGYWKGRS
jgi:hypothetical protein